MGRPRSGVSVLVCFAVLAAAALASCAGEPGSKDRAGAPGDGGGGHPAGAPAGGAGSGDWGVEIQPREAVAGTSLSVAWKGVAESEASVEWLVDGVPVAADGRTFRTAGLRRGSAIQVRATARGQVRLSNVVVLANAPPEVRRVKFVPEVFGPGDTLGVEVETADADGDAVSVAYEWTVNGTPAGSGARLGVAVRRGDAVSVRITPFDGSVRGRTVTLAREVRNTPPLISGVTDRRFENEVFACTVRASDADGDAVRYSLKGAPAGMSIDAGTGEIRWAVPRGFRGKAQATAVAEDGRGGTAEYSFTVEIRSASD